MTKDQIKASIKLCKHRFSLRKLNNSIVPDRVECENKCGANWGYLVKEANGKEIFLDVIE